MILHAMLVSIQSAIDIASHLISQNDLKRPATYRETFDLLGQAEASGPNKSERYLSMKKYSLLEKERLCALGEGGQDWQFGTDFKA